MRLLLVVCVAILVMLFLYTAFLSFIAPCESGINPDAPLAYWCNPKHVPAA